jgi:transposase
MPKVKSAVSGKDPPVSNRTQEAQDVAEELVVENEVEGDADILSIAVVKMKLNTFSSNKQLNTKLRNVVFDMNQLLGETYAFANFHILRLLRKRDTSPDVVIPKIDRSFYYRCLIAASVNLSRDATLGDDLSDSKQQFDQLRDPSVPKVNITGHNQVIADLSISMATMGTNHLWTNIKKRLERFLRWSQPTMKKAIKKNIIDAVLFKPTISLSKIFPNTDTKQKEGQAVARRLREILSLPSSKEYASRAHLLLSMYFYILKETKAAKRVFEEEQQAEAGSSTSKKNNTKKKFAGRTFTLLPLKNGYTINNIQFSSLAILGYLKTLKLEKFDGDGRKEDASKILKKYFDVNMVNTKNRLFGNRIVTDGASVSVLMKKKCVLVCPNNCPCEKKLKELYERSLLDKSDPLYVRVVSVDPGFTDIATTIDQHGIIKSYSSAKYYEKALYNTSRRRTDKWNEETVHLTSSIPYPETDNLEEFKDFAKAYLKNLVEILRHRFSKGYRNMRFLRYRQKKLAIKEICEMIAPKGTVNVIGYGDWNGGGGTPISRRCAGPQQEIKLELSKRDDAYMMSIEEFNSSQTCSCCHNKLFNMKAESVKITKFKGVVTRQKNVGKIHKILHCTNRQAGSSSPLETPRCGTTWNRDVNAAKNILNLTILQMQGLPRPIAMRRR